MQNITYEAIGAGGQVAFIICRFSAVAFQFERKGLLKIQIKPESTIDNEAFFEQLFDVAVESGAEDVKLVVQEDDKAEQTVYEVITAPTDLSEVASLLQSSSLSQDMQIIAVDQAYIPTTPLYLPGTANKPEEGEEIAEDAAEKAFGVLGALDEVADVTKVWTNVRGLDS
ncbi:hypothetical protein QFC22_004200 [Naganishia vaughanmartiniae]|uniref:Uncharacterized protein n=1 Tax=Naganishia vaughanmartiniae TaxID=1424756 RepID=A0ACC2X4M3_9TREE|nr:hypothetical protein QFC22_004200 [Naganishia vaughanmartiniae]